MLFYFTQVFIKEYGDTLRGALKKRTRWDYFYSATKYLLRKTSTNMDVIFYFKYFNNNKIIMLLSLLIKTSLIMLFVLLHNINHFSMMLNTNYVINLIILTKNIVRLNILKNN